MLLNIARMGLRMRLVVRVERRERRAVEMFWGILEEVGWWVDATVMGNLRQTKKDWEELGLDMLVWCLRLAYRMCKVWCAVPGVDILLVPVLHLEALHLLIFLY
ncbi:hypothetical protein CC86DRAFT_64583 [Ophiobolus disseminans]|uniref:Uncharacterized protein n=1 Tax=Ophiobolus disseminans TaxID=1469910 RepID=A0A6A6ZQ37_9PLEO|nr:hypothetical protein CC86DRAFT_64583 [Ophiobolus disseminans]